MDSVLQIPTVQMEKDGSLWPSTEYDGQVDRLRKAIGNEIYLLEVNFSNIYISVSQSGKALTLLDVIDFPKPDPETRLYPHMVVTSDGRGINLGRIARISINQPFSPEGENVVYQEKFLLQQLVYCERRLSSKSIHRATKVQLAKILGRKPGNFLE